MTKELTAVQATRRLSITLDALYRLLYANRLPGARKVGRKWRIPAEVVEARLKQRGE